MATTKMKKAAPEASVDLTTEGKEESTEKHEVQDWFDRWADQLGMRLPEFFGNRLPEFWGAGREVVGVMRIEETVDDDGITIRGEIPGIDPDNDVEITVEGNRLSIHAERRETSEDDDGTRHHSEFRYGSYRRSFPLPAGANTDEISAEYEHGILMIRIPVTSDSAETTRIPIGKGTK